MSTEYEQAMDRARAYRKDPDFADFDNQFCPDMTVPETLSLWHWIEKYADKKAAEALVEAGVKLPVSIQPATP